MIKRKSLLIIIISTLSSLVFSQSEDNGLWLSGSTGYDIAKKLDGSTEFSVRFDNNFSQFSSINVGTGISYKLNKRFKTALDYRYSTDRLKFENRVSIALKWSDKIIKRTELDIKTKLQSEIASNQTNWSNTSRTKFILTHKVKKKKIYPHIFTEWFFGLNPTEYNFDKARIGLGIDFKKLKKQTFSFGYFRNISVYRKSINSNILTFDYKLKL